MEIETPTTKEKSLNRNIVEAMDVDVDVEEIKPSKKAKIKCEGEEEMLVKLIE